MSTELNNRGCSDETIWEAGARTTRWAHTCTKSAVKAAAALGSQRHLSFELRLCWLIDISQATRK